MARQSLLADRSPLAVQLGQRIREIRQLRGLSQVTMAALAQTTSSEVSRAEIGVRLPILPTLRRYASALRVGLGDLLDIEHDALPAKLSVLLADLRAAPPEVQAAALAQVNAYLDTQQAKQTKPRDARVTSARPKSTRSGGGHVG